jgi:hypothetical protein
VLSTKTRQPMRNTSWCFRISTSYALDVRLIH